MTNKQKIAKRAAKIAALETYKAILNTRTRKVAGTGFSSAPSVQDIAKIAATATYKALVRIGQVVSEVPVDYANVATTLQKNFPSLFDYIENEKYTSSTQVPQAQEFSAYVKKGGAGESWAKPDKWPAVVDAICSNITGEYREPMRTYLKSL